MIEKPIFLGEYDGRPLRVRNLKTSVNKHGQPVFSFLLDLYYTEWNGEKIPFFTIKVYSYGKCDLQNGDIVYLQDCPKGKWVSFCRHKKNDGTYTVLITIFANVSKTKGERKIKRSDDEDE